MAHVFFVRHLSIRYVQNNERRRKKDAFSPRVKQEFFLRRHGSCKEENTMRILWICNICLPAVARALGLPGSPKEGWLTGLSEMLLARRAENHIELHVAFPADRALDGRTGEADGLYYHAFYEDVAHAERNDPELPRRIRAICDGVRPDVIHCFGTEYQHTLAALQCGYDRARILVGIQGVCMEIARHYMADLPVEVQHSVTLRDGLKQDSIRMQRDKYVLRGLREQEILKLAQNITGRTGFDKAYALHWNPQANYYSANETLRPCFYEGQWERAKAQPHTIFVSQADYPLKGLHYLLIASGKLRERFPDLQIRVAGNSIVEYTTCKQKLKISAYGRYLRSLIDHYGLTGRIRFLGKLDAEQMKQEYLNCGLFLCCSANENSPNSLGEAMLLGVPCAAANVGGIPDIFTDGEDGVLYHAYSADINNDSYYKKENLSKTAKALYQAVCQAWEDDARTDEFCRHAGIHASKTHDKQQNYAKMTEIYTQISQRNTSC